MCAVEGYRGTLSEEANLSWNRVKCLFALGGFKELSKDALPTIAKIRHSDVTLLYIEDGWLPSSGFLPVSMSASSKL